jgi:putative ABC transport system permease protein
MNLPNQIRLSLRSLYKRSAFTAVVVLTLGLGIGANSAIFSVVHAVLFNPLPFREPNGVAMLSEHSRTMDTGLVSPITYDDWEHRNEVFSELAAFRHWENRTLEFPNAQPEPILQVTATPNYFHVLGFEPLFGRTHDAEKPGGVNDAVLSHELWMRRFGGNRDVLGKTIRISGASFVIVGVMPAAPHDLGIGWGDVWTPIHWYNMQYNRATSYRARYLRVLGRLKPGLTMTQAQGRMDVLQNQLWREATSVAKGYAVRVESLDDALVGRFRAALLSLLGAVVFVLLTACANVANLMLARGMAREKEVAIRRALGASPATLAGELLVESSLLALFGAVLGFVLAYGGLWLLKYSLVAQVPRLAEASLDLPVIVFTLFLAAASALLFSIAPMFGSASGNVHESLKESGRGGTASVQRQHLRTTLVAAEFAFAALLLAGGGLLLKSFATLLRIQPGFETAGRYTADIVIPADQYKDNAQRITFYRELFRRLNETPGIQASGGSLYFPCRGKLWLATVWRDGVPVAKGDEPIVYYNMYAGDYFKAMGIPLVRGRLPTGRELWEPSDVIVINETMARQLFGDIDPIGQRIRSGDDGPGKQIVGIVGDVRQKSLDEPPKPEYYAPFSQMPMTFLTISIHSDLPQSTVFAALRNMVHDRDPGAVPASMTPLGELTANTISNRRLAMLLMILFAALALSLSAVGAYGVMSHAVQQRTAEIGIRMALGAEPANILRLIVTQGLSTAVSGTAIGLIAALAMTNVLASLLYNVRSFDWMVDAAILAVASVVAVTASYIPARRAMRIDPLRALRQE